MLSITWKYTKTAINSTGSRLRSTKAAKRDFKKINPVSTIPEHLKYLTESDRDENPEIDEKKRQARIEAINKFVASIDTTLTPEQRVHVDRLKKEIKGPNYVPCKFALIAINYRPTVD